MKFCMVQFAGNLKDDINIVLCAAQEYLYELRNKFMAYVSTAIDTICFFYLFTNILGTHILEDAKGNLSTISKHRF